MISKEDKSKIIEKIIEKDKKILIASVIDKANIACKTNRIISTDFLDMSEISYLKSYLDQGKFIYTIYKPNKYMEKSIIIFNYEKENQNYNIDFCEYISCIKIKVDTTDKIAHKDYMGSIYSLGIKREKLGDIFVCKNHAYFFCMRSVAEYILLNLQKVANQKVINEEIMLNSQEVQDITLNFIDKNIIISSLRVDLVLSEIYGISRSISKEKILKRDLYINDKLNISPTYCLSEGDIVLFKKCGKFKVGQVIKTTKSDNLVLHILKYN
ncbi:MAG: YlmH/Sll1252 family protein [Clostridia bacterium]